MKKVDYIVLIFLLLITTAVFVHNIKELNLKTTQVVIKQYGKEIKRLDIHVDTKYKVEHEKEYNNVVIENQKVWIESANCSEQLCVHHNPISNVGESIICLPHQLSIEIVGEEEAKYDAISQ